MDYYQILGVSRNASEGEIKQAYKGLARKYHPDANPGNQAAEERFKEIAKAYDTLCDQEKRRAYDRQRPTNSTKNNKTRNQNPEKKGAAPPFGMDGKADMKEFMKQMDAYLGFADIGEEQQEAAKKKTQTDKINPLDVTDMFERFMGIK